MPMNAAYRGPGDLPPMIPVFPLPGALLLPRGQMPLNIFEPRYLAMIDDALRVGHRLIGMIQPDTAHPGPEDKPNLYKIGCVGRITQLAETGDGRYLLELTGVARFRVEEELTRPTPYRQCRVTYAPFADDFVARKGEDAVDRDALLKALAGFLKANKLKADWDGIENAPNEALVNALAMMSPYGAAEKQALLEAPDLKTRAEILVAVTEIELAKRRHRGRDQVAVTCAAPVLLTAGMCWSPAMNTSRTERPASSVDPKLLEILVCPLTKGTLEYDAREAGADLARRQARLSDPRRHPDHAARRGAAAGLTARAIRDPSCPALRRPRCICSVTTVVDRAATRRHDA